LDAQDFRALVDLAWEEDVGRGDVTSDSLFGAQDSGEGWVTSRVSGILCGMGVVPLVISKLKERVEYKSLLVDGSILSPNLKILHLTGSLRGILKIERILLNFLQYLSAIATNTNNVVQKYPHLTILDTRKTLPGYRKLAKYAVYVGGGSNHRLDLSDMVMLKDNHLQKLESLKEAVQNLRKANPQKKIELEIDSLDQLDPALEANPDILLLDNFGKREWEFAIPKIQKEHPEIRIECSGGLTPDLLEDLSKYNGIGVSMGYLTHSVSFLDLSMEIA